MIVRLLQSLASQQQSVDQIQQQQLTQQVDLQIAALSFFAFYCFASGAFAVPAAVEQREQSEAR